MKDKLEVKMYPLLKEKVFVTKLTDGLHIALLPKSEYKEVIGLIATKFGAMDTQFVPKNRKRVKQYPSGIAHFLEHRLFEMSSGVDAMQLFSKLGAEANAFTGHQQTIYYFSTVSQIEEAITILQAFTGQAKFTEAGVEKEKTIISQEIKMYQDEPDFQLYMSTLAKLYPNTPLAKDIAGSLEDIDVIKPSDLKESFDIFYQPSNMLLLLAGPIDVEKCLNLIEINQQKRRKKNLQPIIRKELVLENVLPSSSIEMEVSGPKLAVGIRSQLVFTNMSTLHYRLAIRLFFAMILGWTSTTYQDFYEKGKIDDSFFMEIEITKDYQFAILTLDTSEPLAMSKRLRQLIKDFEKLPDLTEEHLTLVKNEMYGDFLKSMNSLEFMTMQYASSWIEEMDIFQLPQILDELNLEKITQLGRAFVSKAEMTDFIIFPK